MGCTDQSFFYTQCNDFSLGPGDELEYLRPNVYRNVARQLNITVASESVVSDAFLAVAADIFSTGESSFGTRYVTQARLYYKLKLILDGKRFCPYREVTHRLPEFKELQSDALPRPEVFFY